MNGPQQLLGSGGSVEKDPEVLRALSIFLMHQISNLD